jgi:uncharacterized protein (TIGR03083 family)
MPDVTIEPWVANGEGRTAFATYLESLTPEDWATKSWSDQWDVKSVAAHLLVPQTKGKGAVFFAFLSSGFNLDKMNARYVAELTDSLTPAQIIATTRQTAGVQNSPPGLSPYGVHGELAVHATDISEAVGKPFALPPEHYAMALEHYKGMESPFGCKTRIEGLCLRATDVDWTTGDGPRVEGPAQMLVSAMTGRKQAFAHLNGPGVETMASR